MLERTCCFFGHREIDDTLELRERVAAAVEELIQKEGVDTFLFGSKSRFDTLCLEILSSLKQKYPHIKRVYVRAEYPYIEDSYKGFLLKFFEATYYPESILGAGRAVYIKRNFEMIDKSLYCIVYYSEGYAPPAPRQNSLFEPQRTAKSGTKIAFDYAAKKGRKLINLYGQ